MMPVPTSKYPPIPVGYRAVDYGSSEEMTAYIARRLYEMHCERLGLAQWPWQNLQEPSKVGWIKDARDACRAMEEYVLQVGLHGTVAK